MDLFYELTISRNASSSTTDDDIQSIMDEFFGDGTWTGSGSASGGRDLDFRLPWPLTEGHVTQVQDMLRNRCVDQSITVLYEEWRPNDAYIDDGPAITYYGDGRAFN
jgi:hypothetical protein